MIINKITSQEERTKIINMAANYLINNNIATPNDLANIQYVFGFIYTENGDMNSLFSLEGSNQKKYYFRIINNKLYVANNIDEESFNSLTQEIKNQHPELNIMPSNNIVNNSSVSTPNTEMNKNVNEQIYKENTANNNSKQKWLIPVILLIILCIIVLILYTLNIYPFKKENNPPANNNIEDHAESPTNTQKDKNELSVNLCNNMDSFISQYDNNIISYNDFATTAESNYKSSCNDNSNSICLKLKMIVELKNETYEMKDCSKYNTNDETGKSLKDLCESGNSLTQKRLEQKEETQKAYISDLKHSCALERE